MSVNPKLLYFVTEDWYFCSHRLPLAIAARQMGYDVIVVTRVCQHGELIRSHGLNLIHLDLSRRSHNPFKELAVIWKLWRIYRVQRPDIVHHVALKPVLYGAIAARLAKVPSVVSALGGLGFLFVSRKWQAKFLRTLIEQAFRFLLNRSNVSVILQNPDDLALLKKHGIIDSRRTLLIRGAGVDVEQFQPTTEVEGVPVIVLPSRMLWDKGVGEFVCAARLLKQQGVLARFVLVGDSDLGNPASISGQQLSKWHNEGVIEWWGRQDNMAQVFVKSHIVCLPSYREGLPKVLLEAASCGRPIVTTNAPGCREIVKDNHNGLLVPIKDVNALAFAMRKLIDSPTLCKDMGKRGREMVVSEFSLELVVTQTMALYRSLIP